MSTYLHGRERVIKALGWRGRHSDWIALACLNGGYFTRTQLCSFLGTRRAQARHFVRRMLDRRIARELTVDGRRVCRISYSRIYEGLGVPWLWPATTATSGFIMRRLLTLDYILDHPGLPWLPTITERVDAFEALGITHESFPSRPDGSPRPRPARWFPDGFPVALDDDRALFVFIDQGFASATPIRDWGRVHDPLWEAVREQGLAVEVVAVVRSVRELQRAHRWLERWCQSADGPASGKTAELRRELERTERAVIEGDDDALAPYGGFRGAVERLAELRQAAQPRAAPIPSIDAFDIWRSTRIPGGWS